VLVCWRWSGSNPPTSDWQEIAGTECRKSTSKRCLRRWFYTGISHQLAGCAAWRRGIPELHTNGAIDRWSVRAGVHHDQRHVLSSESWEQGQVILSWQDTLDGAAVVDDGRKVVLHEFAHQLDQENGAAQGTPLPAAGDMQHSPQRWKQVFSQAYADLQSQFQRGEQGLFNHYGAQSPAEFFAVATEIIF